MLKIRQYFCKHKFVNPIAKHKFSSQNLWQCPKCKVYCIQHWGAGVSYYHQKPHIGGWMYTTRKLEE